MRKIINIVTIAAILILAVLGVREILKYVEVEQMNDQVRDLVISVPEKDNPEGVDSDDPFERRIDFEALQKINPDIQGWIYIPDTSIDYPVLSGEQYLKRDLHGDWNAMGSIFTYASVDLENDSLVRIYGHNTASLQMFGMVKKYAEQKFADEHTVMYLYTPEKTKECHLLSGIECRYDDHVFTDVPDDIGTYAEELVARSVISTKPQKEVHQVYTLGSCKGRSGTTNRFAASFTVTREKTIL